MHVGELKETIAQGFRSVSTQIDAAVTATARISFDAEIDEAEAYLNSHDPQMAQVHFERVRKRHWDELAASQKYRIKVGFSNIALVQGKDAKAGRLLLEAKLLYPESERAQVNEAMGYEFLGDKERAHALATELLTAYPHSSKALACWIRTAPKDVELDKLKAKVPAALERDSEICTALTLRAIESKRLADAEAFARLAVAGNPTWPRPRWLLAQSILNQELGKQAQSYWTAQRPIESRRLDEVIVAYTEAIDLAKRQNTTYFIVDCFTGRAVARALKGDHTFADEDFNEAIKSGPDNGAVYFQHAMFLADTNRADEAISQCRKSIAIKKGVDAEHCLATLLAERAQPGDQKEASDIFARIALTDDELLSSITPVIHAD